MITSINPNNFKLVYYYHSKTCKSIYDHLYYFSDIDNMLILERYVKFYNCYVYYKEPDNEYLGMVVDGSPSESIFDEPVSHEVKLNSELYGK